MNDLEKVLDQLVAGDEDKAKETFHNMVVQQSRDEWNKLEPQPEQDQPVQEAVDKSALRAWYDKYSKYEGNNDSNLVLGMIKAWTDTGILTDAYEQNEWSAYLKKTGKDSDSEMDAEEFDAFLTPENAPISYGMQAEITKIMGEWEGEETMNKVYDMLQSIGIDEI